jgi:hypothetical protein
LLAEESERERTGLLGFFDGGVEDLIGLQGRRHESWRDDGDAGDTELLRSIQRLKTTISLVGPACQLLPNR